MSLASFETGPHSVDVLPVSFPWQVSDIDRLPSTEKEVISTVDLAAPIVALDELSKTLIMELGEVDAIFSFSFLPEVGHNLSSYRVETLCSNSAVLQKEEVLLGPPVLMQNDRVNFTANIAFERSVGETEVSFIFKKEDNTIYSSVTVHYTICGITFYHVDEASQKKTFLAGNEYATTVENVTRLNGFETFLAFIQFPDGQSTGKPLVDGNVLPDISTMVTTIDGQGPLAPHNFASCLTNHTYRAENGRIVLDDFCSFGFTQWNESQGPYFGVRLLQYRTGTITFHFQWDDFLKGQFAGDIFETSLTIKVSGSSFPSIIAVKNPGPFQRAGGQLIEFVVFNFIANAKYLLKVRGKLSSPLAVKSSPEGWTVLTCVTPPGEGKKVPWDLSYSIGGSGDRVSLPWAGADPRFVFNYVDNDISITSMSPSFGPTAGGTTVTCKGHFGNLTLSDGSRDGLVLGSYFVAMEFIISVTRTAIIFRMPSKNVVQSQHYEIGCYVIVQGVRSNEVSFMYESLRELSIDFTGGSYERKNNTYMVPLCGLGKNASAGSAISMFANVNSDAALDTLSYDWRIVVSSTRGEVAKAVGSTEAQSFSVPLSLFSTHEAYEAILLVSDTKYKTQLSRSVKIQLTKAKVIAVGLTVDQTRTIALPPVDARVSASVTEHGTCFGRNNKLSYDWTFLAITKTLSARSEEVTLSIPSPRRFGREYVIPSSTLDYGKHRVTVKVYYSDDPSIFGTASTWLNVEPADLRPVIGNGESQIQSSGSSDLHVTAERSYDPDDASATSSDDFTYDWKCELSIGGGEQFLTVAPCPEQLLPRRDQKSFNVAVEALKSSRFLNTTFVRYSLIVRKEHEGLGVRSSPQISQIVELLSTEETLASKGFISVATLDGRPLPLHHLPYYDTLVLSPRPPSHTSWRFRLLEPAEETFTLLNNPENLIDLPGFYSPDAMLAGRHALGISKGTLEPDTTYKFEVLFESRDADSPNPVQVTVHTMPKPTVSFLPLSHTSGTTETMFTAVAVSSIDDYLFRYHFYIRMSDGSDMCIDGCSGQHKVSFRIPMVGRHTLRCVMVDARGKYVIGEAKEVQTLDIMPAKQNGSKIEAQTEALEGSFDLGDHSAFEIESIQLAQYAVEVNLNNTQIAEAISMLVDSNVGRLADMFRKSQPNTALARDYMLIAKAYASIPVGHDAMGGVGTFYSLCRMVYYAVQHTPPSERFDMTEEMTTTLGMLAAHAKQIHAQGTTRMRLLPKEERVLQQDGGVNEALLELHELVMPMIARVLARSSGCGEVAAVNVSNVGAVRVATLCSKEQGLSLAGEHATMEWCDDVFAESGQKRVIFVLGEFGDYVKSSGVLTLRKSIGREPVQTEGEVELETGNLASHGFVLTKTMVAKADDDYDVAHDGEGAGDIVTGMAAADLSTGNKSCFSVRQDVRATGALFPEYAEVFCRAASAIEYVNTKAFSVDLPKHGYGERSLSSRIGGDGTRATGETQSGLQVTSLLPSLNGRTFGVKRGQCRDLRPRIFGESASWWVPLAAVVCALLTVLLLGFAGIRREKTIDAELWVDGDAPYIERDAYGRDLGHFDGEIMGVDEVDDEGEDHVVYESPRMKGAADAKAGGTDTRLETVDRTM